MERRQVILIADDELGLLGLLQAFFEYQGYTVLAAADGREALKISRAHRGTIDLLLSDIAMPNIDGISAYQMIRAKRKDIKVLFMSGAVPRTLNIPEGLPFLAKPFDTLEVLTLKVREILNSGKAA